MSRACVVEGTEKRVKKRNCVRGGHFPLSYFSFSLYVSEWWGYSVNRPWYSWKERVSSERGWKDIEPVWEWEGQWDRQEMEREMKQWQYERMFWMTEEGDRKWEEEKLRGKSGKKERRLERVLDGILLNSREVVKCVFKHKQKSNYMMIETSLYILSQRGQIHPYLPFQRNSNFISRDRDGHERRGRWRMTQNCIPGSWENDRMSGGHDLLLLLFSLLVWHLQDSLFSDTHSLSLSRTVKKRKMKLDRNSSDIAPADFRDQFQFDPLRVSHSLTWKTVNSLLISHHSKAIDPLPVQYRLQDGREIRSSSKIWSQDQLPI